MKTTFFLFSICISINSWSATNEIIFEIGQDFILKKMVNRIWVENSKVITVEQISHGVKIKSLISGETRLRVNEETFKVIVVPIGSLKAYQNWKRFSKNFIDLSVAYCGELVCLKGQIFRLKDYLKILHLLEENPSTLYLALDIQGSVKAEVRAFIEKYQRAKGLTPLHTIFSTPWKVQYGNKDMAAEYRQELARIGILAVESKQKVEVADNIKVSIQVTEVKKEFGRSIGIKYPGSYSAQILENNQLKQIPFDLSLNANENQGNFKILASPNLICRSGKEAEFFAGGEFPIRILNFKVNDVVWKKYGIGLKIKPQIDAVGQMSLQIDSEVSSLDSSTTVDGIPGLHTHKVSSYFDLIRSRTIALSGLIKNEQGQSSEGLPFLKQIPILGRLFSSHDFRESRTELVIFVTPELLRNEED